MTTPDIELLEGERLMTDADELAYRQLTPKMFEQNGKPSSHVFGPSSADGGKPSYSRSSIVTPQAARDWHTAYANTPSAGVWAVSVSEVIETGRYVVDDSETPLPASGLRAPGHCFVDFRGLPKPRIREIRAVLLMHALERKEIPTEEPLGDGELLAASV